MALMRDFRLGADLQRAVVNGFAFPLGIKPGQVPQPVEGYAVAYHTGRDDEPDTYSFHIMVSHDRLLRLLRRVFEWLPDEVYGIVEINSLDAYRAVDEYISRDSTSKRQFLRTWSRLEPVLIEEVSIAAGANGEEPFVEVFLDQWKGVNVIVPPMMRDEVESALASFGLEEVPETWPDDGVDDAVYESIARQVLEEIDDESANIEDLLLELRREWDLALNVDEAKNLDDGGRELGLTLWNVLLSAHAVDGAARSADISIWATASSLSELDQLVSAALPKWRVDEVLATDRVAFDHRPDVLGDLAPRRERAEVHLVQVDPWADASREQETHG